MRPCANVPSGKPCLCEPPNNDDVLLQHIAECIARIQRHTGDSRDRFMASELVQDAVLRNLQVLAESASRLSDRFRSTEPAVPWPEITSFRNRLTHGYLAINLDIVWEVGRQDLPTLDAAVRHMRSPDQPNETARAISTLGVKAVRLCRCRQERVFSARKARIRRYWSSLTSLPMKPWPWSSSKSQVTSWPAFSNASRIRRACMGGARRSMPP